MKAELTALAALPREERRILRRAWLSLLLADAALRWSPLSSVQRFLAGRIHRGLLRTGAALEPPRLARLVDIAARHHIRPMGCLPRSLVLQALLRERGVATDLRIGVRKSASLLQAHAWLEQAGKPFCERQEIAADFSPLGRPDEVRCPS
jgi:hypothetical protein